MNYKKEGDRIVSFRRNNENIEKLFREDIREKKKAGSGAFHMRGKGVRHGFNGALRTPYHFMSNKEKKALNGEVEVYSMYETIIPMKEFELKEKEVQKSMLTRWRELYDNKKIVNELGITNVKFYSLVNELDLPKKTKKTPRKGSAKKASSKEEKKSVAISAVSPVSYINDQKEENSLLTLLEEKVEVVQEQPKGIHFAYNGDYHEEDLQKIFTKLQLLIDGESNKFNIKLSLTEIVED
jgi:hypothetical protein